MSERSLESSFHGLKATVEVPDSVHVGGAVSYLRDNDPEQLRRVCPFDGCCCEIDESEVHRITVEHNDLYAALIEWERLCDQQQAWHAIRVDSDGQVYVSTEPSACYSESEYYHRMPHTVTVRKANGAGQCDLPEDWNDDDGELIEQVKELVAILESAGYEVEVV